VKTFITSIIIPKRQFNQSINQSVNSDGQKLTTNLLTLSLINEENVWLNENFYSASSVIKIINNR